jgi:hypothetical protein
MNLQDIKSIANDPANITAMKGLFEAIAYVEVLRPIIEGKQREIIEFYKFEVSEECGRHTEMKTISEPKNMYLSSKQDLKIYCDELQLFYYSDLCPVKPSKPGLCPLLEAEHLVRCIKWELADFFAPVMGMNCDQLTRNLKNWEAYWDIMLGLFAAKVKETI